MLVGALQLIAGGRAPADLVRRGTEEAEVEALFDLSGSADVRRHVREVTGVDDDELVIRRLVRSNGGSRAWINGRLATAGQLASLATVLLDICSQHEHHALRDAASHLDLLDAWAGHDVARARMTSAWDAWRRADAELESLAGRLRERAEREAVLRHQLDEITALQPKAGELEALEEEHLRLRHAERLSDRTRGAEEALYGADDAVTVRVARVLHDLGELRGLDPVLDGLAEQLADAHARLEDVASELGRYGRKVVHDPERLAEIDARLIALRRLARRHGGTLERVLAAREALAAELDGLADAEVRLEEAELARQRAHDEAVATARALSSSRRQAAARLGAAITGDLRELGMGEALVEVAVAPVDLRAGSMEAEGAAVTATGMDRVELLIAPNRGEPPRPLARVASGGELSRALLAVKRVLAEGGPRAVQVFDEVDTGVGGGVAEVIGRKLREVSRARQVLCVTHLPQIAVYGDRHFHVSKGATGDRTVSRVARLDDATRREEIARMMGGLEITDATRAAADALLAQARAAGGA
jgi:DNA repair protein RecN (Recombination protein N)